MSHLKSRYQEAEPILEIAYNIVCSMISKISYFSMKYLEGSQNKKI